jgi:hypothetical protein
VFLSVLSGIDASALDAKSGMCIEAIDALGVPFAPWHDAHVFA